MDTATTDPHSPKSVDQMAGASDWGRLVDLVKRTEPPHVILVGPAGIGKSCALRLALGSSVALWLRASQDPTLRDNRERIKAVARRRVEAGAIGWIVLEHADALHADAQAFLRRIIETTMGSSRFVLEVRDAAAIAEPLLSRCLLFQAPQLLPYEIRAEVLRRSSGITVESATRIAESCDGNVRWAVLQGLGSSKSYGSGVETGCLSVERRKPTGWADLLAVMEEIQTSGSSPRAFSQKPSVVWDRPGGICPWSLLALELSQSLE
jgi:hypothetical protein